MFQYQPMSVIHARHTRRIAREARAEALRPIGEKMTLKDRASHQLSIFADKVIARGSFEGMQDQAAKVSRMHKWAGWGR